MPARQSKVKVFVRMRPTDNFANDIIEIGPDNKVRHWRYLCLVKWSFNMNLLSL